jgi:hypothetical protein
MEVIVYHVEPKKRVKDAFSRSLIAEKRKTAAPVLVAAAWLVRKLLFGVLPEVR